MAISSAFVILVAKDTGTILTVLPTKNLPSARKDGEGRTKGEAKPWALPGGKVDCMEDPDDAIIRELYSTRRPGWSSTTWS